MSEDTTNYVTIEDAVQPSPLAHIPGREYVVGDGGLSGAEIETTGAADSDEPGNAFKT